MTVPARHASPSHSLASGARPVDTSSGLERRTLWSGLLTGLGALSAGGETSAGAGGGGAALADVDAAGVAGIGRALDDESHAESASAATGRMMRTCTCTFTVPLAGYLNLTSRAGNSKAATAARPAHQSRARSSGRRTIASPALHANAAANSGMEENGPFTRQ